MFPAGSNSGLSRYNQSIKHILEYRIRQYSPAVVGSVASCIFPETGAVSHTADRTVREAVGAGFVHVDLSSGLTHVDGFHRTVKAVTVHCSPKALTGKTQKRTSAAVNLFPGVLSNEDLRHLKEIFNDFKTKVIVLPDTSLRGGAFARLGIPMGIKANDRFFRVIEVITGRSMPEKYKRQKQRRFPAVFNLSSS